MSAFVGKILLTIGLGVVSAVVYTFLTERDRIREQHTHTLGGGRSSRYGDSDYSRGRPSFGEREYSDHTYASRRRSDKKETQNETNYEEKEDSQETGSLQKSCPICMESFQDLKRKGIPIYTTPCGHLFCRNCLMQAVQASQVKVCPNCRVKVSYTDCHRIFL